MEGGEGRKLLGKWILQAGNALLLVLMKSKIIAIVIFSDGCHWFTIIVVVVASAQPMQYSGWLHDPFNTPPSNLGHGGVNEFEEVVGVSDSNTNQIHDNRVTNQGAKSEHNPGQIRRVKGQEAQKYHSSVFVASTPDVCHHECEGVAEKV